jgi:hypothetical protein
MGGIELLPEVGIGFPRTPGSHRTPRWRERISNLRFRDALAPPTARPWFEDGEDDQRRGEQHHRQCRREWPIEQIDLLLDQHCDHQVAWPSDERRRDEESRAPI